MRPQRRFMPSRFNVSITILSCLRTRRSANLKNQSRLLSAMCLLTLARCRYEKYDGNDVADVINAHARHVDRLSDCQSVSS